MGRVVKGARFREERYALEVPEIAPPSVEPIEFVSDAFTDDFGFVVDQEPLLADRPLTETEAEPSTDLDATHERAQEILDEAGRNAETLLNDALERSRTLVEDAAARADAIAQEARTRGRDEGVKAGREAADREMNEMLVTMRGLLEAATAERRKIVEAAEPELVRLALGIAERVLHQQIALDRGVVVEMARNAISRLIDRETVTIRVNPADIERMREHRDELVALGDIRNLRVIEDQRVDRGGVVVETGAGTIDARIATQLEEARKVLHIEEDVIVEPAPSDVVMKSEFTSARAS